MVLEEGAGRILARAAGAQVLTTGAGEQTDRVGGESTASTTSWRGARRRGGRHRAGSVRRAARRREAAKAERPHRPIDDLEARPVGAWPPSTAFSASRTAPRSRMSSMASAPGRVRRSVADQRARRSTRRCCLRSRARRRPSTARVERVVELEREGLAANRRCSSPSSANGNGADINQQQCTLRTPNSAVRTKR